MRRRISNLIAIGVALMAVAGCESGKKTALLAPPAEVYASDSSVSGMLTTAEAQPTAAPVAPPPYMPEASQIPGAQKYMPGQYGSPYRRTMSDIFPWSLRLGAGMFLPDATTLQATSRMDVMLVSYQGPYSLELGVGYYQMADDQLGGHVSVMPITVGAKGWLEVYPGSVKSFLGLSLGPYICDHSRTDVSYSSTLGLDFVVGLSLESEDRTMALGAELGYTINRPSITIGGSSGDDNLNGGFIKATRDLFF